MCQALQIKVFSKTQRTLIPGKLEESEGGVDFDGAKDNEFLTEDGLNVGALEDNEGLMVEDLKVDIPEADEGVRVNGVGNVGVAVCT